MLKSKFAWIMFIVTFALSASLNSALILQTDLPTVEVDYLNFQRNEKVILTGQIEIEPATFKLGSDPKEVTFKVTNLTDEPIFAIYGNNEQGTEFFCEARQNKN